MSLEQNDSVDTKITSTQSRSEWVSFIAFALFVVLPIRLWVAQPFVVNGGSMIPTFENGDYLIVDQLTYHFGDPKRGEVVIFKYPKDPSKFFIKRVVGLPGETIEIINGRVNITKKGEARFEITESYAGIDSIDYLKTVLKQDEYYLMGDNRPASSDSRVWGPVKRDLIVGRPFLRLLPISQIDIFPGNYADVGTTTAK